MKARIHDALASVHNWYSQIQYNFHRKSMTILFICIFGLVRLFRFMPIAHLMHSNVEANVDNGHWT